jgi:hypothetical protein
MTSSGALRRASVAFILVGVAAAACSSGSSTPSAQAPGTESVAPAEPSTPGETTATSPAPASDAAVSAAPPSTPAGSGTTFTLVLADGPRAGTYEVTDTGQLPLCQNDPDREAWTATWLGPPPLSFIDSQAANDRDPRFMFKFTDEPDELDFSPSGDVTFTADDRGDSATLTWVSETNDGSYFDSQGNKTGSAEMGRAELTIECGSVFRFS